MPLPIPIFKATFIIEDGKGLTQTFVFEKTEAITTSIKWEEPELSFDEKLKTLVMPRIEEFAIQFKPLPDKEGVYYTEKIVRKR